MACTREAPCGAVIIEDGDFNAAMSRIGSPLRRDKCLNGHPFARALPKPRRRGRARRGTVVLFRCAGCLRLVERYVRPSRRRKPTTCSDACRLKVLHRENTKITPKKTAFAATLYRRGHSIPRIARYLRVCARTVERMLAASGTPVRRYTSATRCIHPGCSASPMKQRNQKGYLWGRRCRKHQNAHQRAARQRRQRRRDLERRDDRRAA